MILSGLSPPSNVLIYSHCGLSIPAQTTMTDLQYTPVEDIVKVRLALSSVSRVSSLIAAFQIHASLQSGFRSGKARDTKYRKHQLLQLAYLLKDNKDRFNEAAERDLGRSYPENEMYVGENTLPLSVYGSHRDLASNTTSPLSRSNTSLTTSRNGLNQRVPSFLPTLVPGRRFARNQKGLCSSSCRSITPSCF